MRPRVAVVGAGAGGLTAAWALVGAADVTLFERDERIGGHGRSVHAEVDGLTGAVDLGAQFFHPPSYPTFFALLRRLGVPTRASPQTFTVLHDGGRDYFRAAPQLRNLTGPGSGRRRVWLAQTLALRMHHAGRVNSWPWARELADGIRELRLDPEFVARVLYPVVGASFGTDAEQSRGMSARAALYYLTGGGRPVGLWSRAYREVVGGCSTWMDAAARALPPERLRLQCGVLALERVERGWIVLTEQGPSGPFDHVVCAQQPRDMAALLPGSGAWPALRRRFDAVGYVRADMAIHGDARVLPRDRAAWKGYVVHDAAWAPGATVWLGARYDGRALFKSWASHVPIDGPLYASATFWHPVMDRNYFAAQDAATARQGLDGLHIAGSFALGVDNHESAVRAGLQTAARIAPGAPRLWAFGHAVRDGAEH